MPTGWYLECTTAGTSSSSDLAISSLSIGSTVTDGTVVWTVRIPFNTNGGPLTGTIINRINDDGLLILSGENSLSLGTKLELYGRNATPRFNLQAADRTTGVSLIGKPDKTLTWDGNDLGGAAIVAQNLVSNGYIKFACGLLIQWTHNRINDGNEWTTSNTGSGLFRNVPFPIAYTIDSSINMIVFFASYREGGFSSFVKVKTGSYSLTVFEEWISEMPSSPYASFEHLSIGL